jgi:hypothetical protein
LASWPLPRLQWIRPSVGREERWKKERKMSCQRGEGLVWESGNLNYSQSIWDCLKLKRCRGFMSRSEENYTFLRKHNKLAIGMYNNLGLQAVWPSYHHLTIVQKVISKMTSSSSLGLTLQWILSINNLNILQVLF